ncbi:hypothetical protein KA344_01795 [bacterium]|nr:hypothetical protein [bacterium]
MEEITFSTILFYVGLVFGGIMFIIAIFSCWFTVDQQTRRVVSRFGQFIRIASPGLNFKIPFIDSVSDEVSLRVRPLDLTELSYTDKGTSVTITANVQYYIDENNESVMLAFYKLANPDSQITSHVSSAIRSKVPHMTLEAVQNNQAEIASHVKTILTETMREYGYVIKDVLITKADPNETVVAANNEKYASEQAKVTAENIAAANYTKVVEAARAESEAMELHGQGIAKERAAIIEGLQTSIKEFESHVPGTTAADAMGLVQFQQYVDAMTKMGTSANAKLVFMPSGGDAVSNLMSQLTNSIIVGQEATKDSVVTK